MLTKTRLHKELVDQGAHATAALVTLIPFGLAPCLVTGALAGFAIGLVRELTEEGEVSLPALKSALHSRLDLTFWTIGGGIAGLFAGITA